MRNGYLKGVAALSAAGLLLFGAGSAVHAELAPPNPTGVDTDQAQQQAMAPGDYTPASQVQSQHSPRYGSAAPERHSAEASSRHSSPQDVGYTPAPPSSASANSIDARILDTCVSCTNAGAGNNSARARATAIRLLGNNIQGGEGTGSGKNEGALLAVPASPLLYLAVAHWFYNTNAGATSTSHSRAALVDLVIGPDANTKYNNHQDALPGAISLAVLKSTSDAGYQGLSSTGNGSNNGVDLSIGNGALVIILLHSDANSANKGSAYVLGINGTQILSSDQTGGGGVPIAVPGVVGLVLLQVGANGGNGSNGGSSGGTGAAVGTVSDLLGQSGQQAGVLTASAVGLAGVTAVPNAGIPPATGTPAAAAAAAAGGLKAPNTGAAFGLGGLLLLLAGGSLLFATLRRRNA